MWEGKKRSRAAKWEGRSWEIGNRLMGTPHEGRKAASKGGKVWGGVGQGEGTSASARLHSPRS